MESIRISDVHYEMLRDQSKKCRMKAEDLVEELIQEITQPKRRDERYLSAHRLAMAPVDFLRSGTRAPVPVPLDGTLVPLGLSRGPH